MFPPSRIVCLTEETVETLYLLGEQDRIVGISGYVVRRIVPDGGHYQERISIFSGPSLTADRAFWVEQFHARIPANNATRLSGNEWLCAATRA